MRDSAQKSLLQVAKDALAGDPAAQREMVRLTGREALEAIARR
ncbi:MAG: hypothetical protein R3E74_10110 [Pseudomonadales bacterium]